MTRGGSLRSEQAAHQAGASLIVTLLMLIAVLMLGVSAAQIALQAEKSSRNERDREIAFQAAEAALMDAEQAIENSPDAVRSNIDASSASGEPGRDTPAWIHVDFDNASASMHVVSYGTFTGRSFPTGKASLPSRLPHYVIESLPYHREGESAEKPAHFYRITAIGYGARDNTQVVLQSFYRKEN